MISRIAASLIILLLQTGIPIIEWADKWDLGYLEIMVSAIKE